MLELRCSVSGAAQWRSDWFFILKPRKRNTVIDLMCLAIIWTRYVWRSGLVVWPIGRSVSRMRQGSHCHAIYRRLIFAHSMPIILIQITGIINEPLDVRAMQISLRYTRPSNYGFEQFNRVHLKKFAIKFTEMIKTLPNIRTREMLIIFSLSFSLLCNNDSHSYALLLIMCLKIM